MTDERLKEIEKLYAKLCEEEGEEGEVAEEPSYDDLVEALPVLGELLAEVRSRRLRDAELAYEEDEDLEEDEDEEGPCAYCARPRRICGGPLEREEGGNGEFCQMPHRLSVVLELDTPEDPVFAGSRAHYLQALRQATSQLKQRVAAKLEAFRSIDPQLEIRYLHTLSPTLWICTTEEVVRELGQLPPKQG